MGGRSKKEMDGRRRNHWGCTVKRSGKREKGTEGDNLVFLGQGEIGYLSCATAICKSHKGWTF